MKQTHLNWLERWALRLLHHSPRVSLLILKPVDTTLISWSARPDDEIATAIINDLLCLPETSDDEPASMLLERLYHAPSYGERE